MPDNTLLFLGLGLAAFMVFQNRGNGEETDLVDASMLSQGTGRTGLPLDKIPVVKADQPIGTPETAPFDFRTLWSNLFGQTKRNLTPGTAETPIVNEDLVNERLGPSPKVDVSPFVQTPEYIRTTGELAGTAIRQLGLERGVDVLNDRIYIKEISVTDDEGIERMQGPLFGDENVQIVAGGANPGDPYFTTMDVLAAAKDQGYFGPLESSRIASARSNYMAPINESLTVTGGVPVEVEKTPMQRYDTVDTYDGGWF